MIDKVFPLLFAAAIGSITLFTGEAAIGFSHNTCSSVQRIEMLMAACTLDGVQTSTTSTAMPAFSIA